MKCITPYIAKAEEIIASIDMAELREAGILREKESYDFIVQYPAPLTLEQMPGRILYL